MHIEIKEDKDFTNFEHKRLQHHFSSTTAAIRFAMRLFTQHVDELLTKPTLHDEKRIDS